MSAWKRTDQKSTKQKHNTHPKISPKHLNLTLSHSRYPIEGSYTDEVEELGGPREVWFQVWPQCQGNTFPSQCSNVTCSQQTGQALYSLLATRNSIWSQETSPSKYDVLPKKVSFVWLPGSNGKIISSKKTKVWLLQLKGFSHIEDFPHIFYQDKIQKGLLKKLNWEAGTFLLLLHWRAANTWLFSRECQGFPLCWCLWSSGLCSAQHMY